MAVTNTVSMSKVKDILNFTIDNNFRLQEEGLMPIAIGIEGAAGIGKTSIVKQVAQERGMNLVKLNLAQLEEPGDIVGYPIKEYECQLLMRKKKEDGTYAVTISPKTVWVNEKQLDSNVNPNIKYQQTGKTRMGYAKPAWVPDYNENGTILLADDYNRANQALLNAFMEVILEQKYASWSLPKKTTVVISQNPDDGCYNVQSQDEAQIGRFVNYNAEFEIDSWARWSESVKLDGRCINFVMSYSDELFKADEEGNRICNPRSFVMFANMISGIKDWDKAENLEFISLIAKGCFKDDGGRFSSMFTSFIRNKMHLIIQPKDMLEQSWDTVKSKLESTLFDADGTYRPDIASLLERRFSNYINAWLDSDQKTPISKVKDRILEFMDYRNPNTNDCFFNADMFYHMIKTITSEHRKQTNALLYEPKIAKVIS